MTHFNNFNLPPCEAILLTFKKGGSSPLFQRGARSDFKKD